jgi:methylenetetrahydrofolate dehydrogenase (NADP+)/methenyltetrahydrofolate cyclohydrolase
VGVKATQLVVPFGSDTAAALRSVRHALEDETLDAVFLEFPFPPGIDGDALTEVIPPALDVDIMTAARIRAFMDGADPRPPLTAAAALALVDGYGVGIAGRACAVVADDSPFARMFAQAFERRGATPARLVSPDSAHLAGDLADAEVAIIAAGRPGLVPTSLLAGGAVAIDAGYFNPGGVGDVDVSAGLTHLQAFAPVPGGIGPMTISALLDRVVEFAEADGAVKSPP